MQFVPYDVPADLGAHSKRIINTVSSLNPLKRFVDSFRGCFLAPLLIEGWLKCAATSAIFFFYLSASAASLSARLKPRVQIQTETGLPRDVLACLWRPRSPQTLAKGCGSWGDVKAGSSVFIAAMKRPEAPIKATSTKKPPGRG